MADLQAKFKVNLLLERLQVAEEKLVELGWVRLNSGGYVCLSSEQAAVEARNEVLLQVLREIGNAIGAPTGYLPHTAQVELLARIRKVSSIVEATLSAPKNANSPLNVLARQESDEGLYDRIPCSLCPDGFSNGQCGHGAGW